MISLSLETMVCNVTTLLLINGVANLYTVQKLLCRIFTYYEYIKETLYLCAHIHLSLLGIYRLAFPKSQTDNMSPSDYADMLENCTGTPWSHCHNCKQEYQGDLRQNLAEMWVDAVENNDDSDPQHEIAMLNFAEASMKINAYDLAIQICDNIRAIVKLKLGIWMSC